MNSVISEKLDNLCPLIYALFMSSNLCPILPCIALYCSAFLTIHFRHFDFIECFNLYSDPKSLFERLSISDFYLIV